MQEELSGLQAENSKLRSSEQQLNTRLRWLEQEQERGVEESLRLRGDLDRHRQDLAQNDSTIRELRQQVSAKESEVAEAREQLKSQDKKS